MKVWKLLTAEEVKETQSKGQYLQIYTSRTKQEEEGTYRKSKTVAEGVRSGRCFAGTAVEQLRGRRAQIIPLNKQAREFWIGIQPLHTYKHLPLLGIN
ncbi:hypothetical protein LXL04_034657 [Taraxacum kok-saghyz]